jgi:hypothetical protein
MGIIELAHGRYESKLAAPLLVVTATEPAHDAAA